MPHTRLKAYISINHTYLHPNKQGNFSWICPPWGPTYIESRLFVTILQAFTCRDLLEIYAQVYIHGDWNTIRSANKIHHIKLMWLLNWQHKLTASDNLGLRGLGVAMCIHLQTSKSSPAILWLSTRMRDSFALRNRTALFHALDNLCLLRQKWS